MTGIADAVDRETVWLSAYSPSDGLPALLSTRGGPWEVVQAYWPRTLSAEKTGVYVLRTSLDDERTANIRIRPMYMFRLKLIWPVRLAAAGLAESEQRNLDAAVALLVQRIRGLAGDKTHGGAFLSAGEVPRMPGVHVEFDDPEITIPHLKSLRGLVTYPADDFEVNA
jgi:hypothetical protein